MGNCCEKCFKALGVSDRDKEEEALLKKRLLESTSTFETKKPQIEDFKFIKQLGEGSFGKVYLVEYKLTQEQFAMKIISKQLIKEKNFEHQAKLERLILSTFDHPFLVTLFCSFQSKHYLYFVTEYLTGGSLKHILEKGFFFSGQNLKIIFCEIIIAIDFLHKHSCIYRDLKLDNILIHEGHIKLIDFGLSKLDLTQSNDSNYSVCGTIEYMAPEILERDLSYDFRVDWFSLGAIIFEMTTGISPFRVYKDDEFDPSIRKRELYFNERYFDKDLKNFVQGLLVYDANKRLGQNIEEIKEHEYFKDINWEDIENQKLKFDVNEKSEEKIENSVSLNITNDIDKNFKKSTYENFTYIKNDFVK